MEWLQNDWKDLVLEKINKENLQTLNLDSRFYINLVEEFYQGKCEYTNQIWFVLNLVLWFEAFSNIEKVKYT